MSLAGREFDRDEVILGRRNNMPIGFGFNDLGRPLVSEAVQEGVRGASLREREGF